MKWMDRRKFDRCGVRVVEFGEFVYTNEKSMMYNYEKKVEDPHKKPHAGYHATLHCPRTEDERVSVTSEFMDDMSKPEALTSLRTLAGELVCRGCRFADMDPVEVAQHRTALARAEAERLEALTFQQCALAELEALDPTRRPQIEQ